MRKMSCYHFEADVVVLVIILKSHLRALAQVVKELAYGGFGVG